MFKYSQRLIVVPLIAASLALTSCTNGKAPTEAAPESADQHTGHNEHNKGEHREVSELKPRVVFSHDNGLTTIDPETGDIINEVDRPGFLRLSGAGDGRHVMVTEGDKLLVFDSGLIDQPHGEHSHYYEETPRLTDVSYDIEKAGHVVPHDGSTALFSDGTGEVTVVPTDAIADAKASSRTISTGEAHHGVAIPLADDSLIHTVGNEDERFTIRQVDARGETLTETTECPNIHGEAASSEGFAFGCTDGPVVFRDGEFHKIKSDGYQRNGNLAGAENSPIVLGDNKLDEDAEQEHPTSIALIDTEKLEVKEVELGSTYWFRSLGRGPGGEGLVLTNDGNLTVIDEETGDITQRIAAIEPWEEKEKWQKPGPILQVAGEYAYITDAENRELIVIDLFDNEIVQRHELDFAPVEMAVATG
ncbi:hypothetical protein QP027_03340 [Corynebacterium breve]|uniref:Secreted protein n=1 Tax=Corynebacterium breve TaxID=3049799 RepID=A0ABY8VG30_9CORY|nr:hypothetical protein [Corynebacterium breve]WIM68444.1 hypothetical protein QP027_03340 [Corynebacterium breve]